MNHSSVGGKIRNTIHNLKNLSIEIIIWISYLVHLFEKNLGNFQKIYYNKKSCIYPRSVCRKKTRTENFNRLNKFFIKLIGNLFEKHIKMLSKGYYIHKKFELNFKSAIL